MMEETIIGLKQIDYLFKENLIEKTKNTMDKTHNVLSMVLSVKKGLYIIRA
jgi:hypothetical protein